jgi:hypothetical protein
MAKSADDFLRVMHIHLATESFEIKRFFRRHIETEYTAVRAGHEWRSGHGRAAEKSRIDRLKRVPKLPDWGGRTGYRAYGARIIAVLIPSPTGLGSRLGTALRAFTKGKDLRFSFWVLLPLAKQRLRSEVFKPRPGGPTAKRQPSPAGLGINFDDLERRRRGTQRLLAC